MDSQVRKLAARQQDVVAAWQLRRIGWTWDRVRHQCRGWRSLHRGGYLLTDDQLGRAFREAIRLKRTTARKVLEALERHTGRPGAAKLRARAIRYAHIPYSRTRSDAEGLALETLHDAQVELPQVNVKVAG